MRGFHARRVLASHVQRSIDRRRAAIEALRRCPTLDAFEHEVFIPLALFDAVDPCHTRTASLLEPTSTARGLRFETRSGRRAFAML